VKFLLLDNYDSFTYNLYHYLLLGGAEQVEVVRNDKISLEEVEVFDAIVLSPGPGLPQEAGLMPEIVSVFSGKKPFLGVCLGHQALGQFFGAPLKNLRSIYHGVSRKTILQSESFLYSGVPPTFLTGRYHSWGFYEKNFPACLEITATDAKKVVMSFQHRFLPITGIQYHPESILSEYGHTIVRNWVSSVNNSGRQSPSVSVS
jgi:anthranilate synthase component 2